MSNGKTQGLRSLATTTALTAAIGMVALPGLAGNHWLSRVNIQTNAGETVSVTPMNRSALASLPDSTRSATAVFDLVISLEENPTGDDDATTDPGTTDDAQNLFEARIRQFANAVFEATNGRHKIGRVTIYRNYDQRNLADVQWEQNCANDNGPWSHVGGFQKAGKFIHFCTNWDGSTNMAAPRFSGFTLAHEWGHYVYNLYDEYSAEQCEINVSTLFGLLCVPWHPRDTDIVTDSLMHSQWFAASDSVRTGYTGASTDYLEFSTPDHAPYRTPLPEGTAGRTGHERYFGESVWETLTRNPATDPTYPGLDRTQYTTLVAPEAPTWRVINGTAGAQTELDIRWVKDQVTQLVIDRSGSMRGNPLVNAKLGAAVLIAQLPPGDAAVGVGSFAGDTTQDFPIANIPEPDPSVRADATSAVNSLIADGQAAMYDGLLLALDQIQAFDTADGGTRESVVYVLADGADTVSNASEAEVIAAYQAEGVPIVAFGYGTAAPTNTLTAMAGATGGLYLRAPASAPDISAAFLSAYAAFSNNSLVSIKTVPATASARTTTTIPIDGTLGTVSLAVAFSGNAGDLTLTLRDPAGNDTGVTFSCSGAASCTGELDPATLAAGGVGDYELVINNAALTDLDISIIVSGTPAPGRGYSLALNIGSEVATTYPAPMLIEATVRGEAPISGLNVVATITDPTDTETVLTLSDGGTNGDAIADDGTYTASFHYTGNGTHSITVVADNAAGNGQTTAEGVAVSIREDGTATIPRPISIADRFERTSSASSIVQGFLPDDHASVPSVPAVCTSIGTNNTRIFGRIDFPQDIDCFFFAPDLTDRDLVVRATGLSGSMSPAITVFDAAGRNVLLVANEASSENPQVGTISTIPASALVTAGHVVTVTHADGSADRGNYRLSIGPRQVSDVKQAAQVDEAVSDAGGAIGPWGVLVLGLLSLLGLRQRRR